MTLSDEAVIRRVRGAVGLLLLSAIACGPPAARSTSAALRTASASASALASTTNAAPVVRAPNPPPPKTVACGMGDCVVPDEKCCDGASPTCIPASATCEGQERRCDDASDCPSGQVCCQGSPFRPDATSGPATFCGQVPCDVAESCVPRGTCSRGLLCEPFQNDPRRAECSPPPIPAHCGGKACPSAAPLCCLDETGPRCAASDTSCNMLGGALRCTMSSDCAPYVCCSYKGMTTKCQDSCAGYWDTTVCVTVADCPPRANPNVPGAMLHATACAEAPKEAMLPGVRECRYPRSVEASIGLSEAAASTARRGAP